MGGSAALFFLPVLMYAVVQTARDVRSKAWLLSTWGLLTILIVAWATLLLLSGPQH